ncbi:MAG: hypothetical protein K6U87_14460 [Firmicutes bacterium]|nr:hypothetical protein [Bacillota bacterium]
MSTSPSTSNRRRAALGLWAWHGLWHALGWGCALYLGSQIPWSLWGVVQRIVLGLLAAAFWQVFAYLSATVLLAPRWRNPSNPTCPEEVRQRHRESWERRWKNAGR